MKRTADGEPIPRTDPQTPTRCADCPKVPEWAKKQGKDWRELRTLAVEITPENAAAFQFYRECRAVNQFPDDSLVRWYAEIIRGQEDEAAAMPLDRMTAANLTLMQILSMRFRRA